VPDSDRLLADQVAYYRARAAEYDATSYGVEAGASAAVPAIVDGLGIAGDVLEIACGTGIWTVELARRAKTLTALDSAPEMVAIAEDRTASFDVTFINTSVFDWTPDTSYDVIFFAAWLSHVPEDRFEAFWQKVAQALRPGGRVVVVDELPERAHVETWREREIARRTLADGSEYDIVKVFYSAAELTERLANLGWATTVAATEHNWFVADVSRSR
jgi:trans-aconitate methyltransferase